ncbi:hypothetical protein ACFOFO_00725 [Undibacterium arcticum]|uniref:Uncharacterized protein n=1 Tax=Undibacterium arcticum TaxID=1762892 RepID=A0ABV7EUN5_9BURK
MLIFLDTEFTDFIDIELISIGLVSQDGREFYAERNDFDVAKCNNFVRAGILPMLTQNDSSVAMTRAELKVNLLSWLSQFRHQGEIQVGFDYSTDWELFLDALDGEQPSWIGPALISDRIDQARRESYFQLPGAKRHHALHDARANRHAFFVV